MELFTVGWLQDLYRLAGLMGILSQVTNLWKHLLAFSTHLRETHAPAMYLGLQYVFSLPYLDVQRGFKIVKHLHMLGIESIQQCYRAIRNLFVYHHHYQYLPTLFTLPSLLKSINTAKISIPTFTNIIQVTNIIEICKYSKNLYI